MKIATKLGLSMGFMLLLLIAIAIFSLNRMHRLAAITADLQQHPLTVSNATWRADGNIVRMHRSMKDIALAETAQEIDNASAAISGYEGLVYDDLALMRERFLGDPRLVTQAQDELAQWKPVRDQVIALKRKHQDAAALVLHKHQAADQVAKISATIAQIENFASKRALRFVDEAKDAANQAYLATYLAIAFAVIVAIVLTWALLRNIVGRIGLAIDVARGVAQGDLSHSIEHTGTDEAGDLLKAFGAMNGSLTDITTRLRDSATVLTEVAGKITQGNAYLAERNEQHEQALGHTTVSVEKLTATVGHNASRADNAHELVGAAAGVAVSGAEIMARVVATIGLISTSSNKIADHVRVIDDIAFQTNILALNAAVEAARAGEHGRGFAVVASEVRQLSQRSAFAAKEIKALIAGSVHEVRIGHGLVQEAGHAIRETAQSIQRASSAMNEISAASREQNVEISEVNEAIAKLQRVARENAVLVEQVTVFTESLQEQAHDLSRIVQIFKVKEQASVYAGDAVAESSAPSPGRAHIAALPRSL